MPGKDVTRAVAYHEAARKVDFEPARGGFQHANPRLSAVASRVLPMRANFDGVNRYSRCEALVHRLDLSRIDQTVTDVGLICYDNYQ